MLISHCPATEYQTLTNIVVETKTYVPVELLNGYQTEIPVVNGLLPQVEQRYVDGKVQLILDYGKGVAYTPTNARIKYVKVQDPPKVVEAPTKPLKRENFSIEFVKKEDNKVIKTESDEELDLIFKNMAIPSHNTPSRVILPTYED